jgi:hypothetical protein
MTLRCLDVADQTLIEKALLQGPTADDDRARLLNNLSGQLSDSGDRAGALRAIQEATEIYRRLAQAQPAAFEPDLAGSLNNLSNRLAPRMMVEQLQLGEKRYLLRRRRNVALFAFA